MGQFDYFTSGEARRVFMEGERRNAEVFLRMAPVQPRIVTFKDWLDARTPGRVVYYKPEDGTPTY